MSETFRCDDKEMLVDYLYGEIDQDGRREVDRHLRTCAACTREIEALQAVRHDLQAWTPPVADVGVVVAPADHASRPAPVLTSSRWSALRDLPAWAQVAAAVLIMGVGAAIANVQVRTTPDGLVVTTGWMAPAAPPPAVTAAPSSDQEWRRELASLEQTLRDEIAAQQAAISTAATPRRDDPADAAAILRRVQSMIAASEERQRQELAVGLTMAERSWNQRRSVDWATISQRMSTLQGRTFAVEAGQQEMINRLRRASLSPPNQ